MPGKIFINYRRDDSSGMAGRLHDRMAQAFGRKNVFMDVDHIPVGVDFVNHLNSQLAVCDVFLAVIGPNWLNAKDENGERRLDSPDDFVAIEVGAALSRDIRVIPVLVEGARMPKASELPEPIKPLLRRQAVEVRHAHFGRDADALVARVREALGDDAPLLSRRWALAGAAVAVLLLAGWFGFSQMGVSPWTPSSPESTQQDTRAADDARTRAEAEAKRNADEAERQRLAAARQAALKAEEDRKRAEAASRSSPSPLPQLRWRLASSFPQSIPNAAEIFVKRVAELSGGRIEITLFHAGEIVPSFQVLDAVTSKTVEVGYTLGQYFVGKDPAFPFLSVIPFGLEPRAHLAWRQRSDTAATFDRFLAAYGIATIPCGAFGRPEDFVSRKPIRSTADLNGLKMRVVGLPGQIYAALKVVPQLLSGGEIYPALERGLIDAAQWLTPRSTAALGLNRVARYSYYPGVVVPAQTVDLFINRSAWASLPPAAQQIFEKACVDAANAMIADYETADRAAVAEMTRSGSQIAPLPGPVQKQLYDASRQILSELAAKNATVRSVMQTLDAMAGETIAAKIR